MEVTFTEEEVLAFKEEYQQCVQRVQELQQEINRLNTRGVELQGLIRIISEKEQENSKQV